MVGCDPISSDFRSRSIPLFVRRQSWGYKYNHHVYSHLGPREECNRAITFDIGAIFIKKICILIEWLSDSPVKFDKNGIDVTVERHVTVDRYVTVEMYGTDILPVALGDYT